MAYPDKINNLVAVTGDQTLAAGGHAARHNDVKGALEELADVVTVPAADTLAFAPDGSTERVRITSAGNVGIGTTSPQKDLHISGTSGLRVTDTGNRAELDLEGSSGDTDGADVGAIAFRNPTDIAVSEVRTAFIVSELDGGTATNRGGNLKVFTKLDNSTSLLERMRINNAGAIMIGTTTPGSASAGDLVVNGGVFLGGTSAANELDDYEEGTWTPTYEPASGAFTSISYQVQSGTYVKIGRTVVVQCEIMTDAITLGTASGSLYIANLPFITDGAHGVTIGQAANWTGEHPIAGKIGNNSTRVLLFYRTSVSGNTFNSQVSDLNTASANFRNIVNFNAVYMTDT